MWDQGLVGIKVGGGGYGSGMCVLGRTLLGLPAGGKAERVDWPRPRRPLAASCKSKRPHGF